MTRPVLTRRTVSAFAKRFRTTTAYSRRQPASGWAADADSGQLELSAMAAASA